MQIPLIIKRMKKITTFLVLLILTVITIISCDSGSPFEAGKKQIDFVVVNSSSVTIKVLASGIGGYGSILSPGEKTGGSGTNVDWVEVSIYVIRNGEWNKTTEHKFYSSGTWHYRD